MFGALVNNVVAKGNLEYALSYAYSDNSYALEYYFLEYCKTFNISITRVEDDIPNGCIKYTLTKYTE